MKNNEVEGKELRSLKYIENDKAILYKNVVKLNTEKGWNFKSMKNISVHYFQILTFLLIFIVLDACCPFCGVPPSFRLKWKIKNIIFSNCCVEIVNTYLNQCAAD